MSTSARKSAPCAWLKRQEQNRFKAASFNFFQAKQLRRPDGAHHHVTHEPAVTGPVGSGMSAFATGLSSALLQRSDVFNTRIDVGGSYRDVVKERRWRRTGGSAPASQGATL